MTEDKYCTNADSTSCDDVVPLEQIGKMGTVKVYNQAYVDKLEKQNKELQEKLDFFLTEKVDGKEYRPKQELEKLQEELEEWKAEWQEQVQKATDEGYARTLFQIENGKLKEQIEKMKEDVRTNIKVAEQSKNNQMYFKLNSMINQWELAAN